MQTFPLMKVLSFFQKHGEISYRTMKTMTEEKANGGQQETMSTKLSTNSFLTLLS